MFRPGASYWQAVFSGRIRELDTVIYLYRYVSRKELEFIRSHGMVYSVNPYGTYWTTLLTDDPDVAMCRLALSYRPEYRVGGFPLESIDRG